MSQAQNSALTEVYKALLLAESCPWPVHVSIVWPHRRRPVQGVYFEVVFLMATSLQDGSFGKFIVRMSFREIRPRKFKSEDIFIK